MTDPYAAPEDGGPRPSPSWVGIAIGAVVVAPVLAFLVLVGGFAGGPAAALALAAVQTGWALYLVSRPSPVTRGIGIGMLVVGSLMLLLVGSCVVMLEDFQV